MATLYKRATPAQRQMLRIIEGAVLNAHHAHPGCFPTDGRINQRPDITIERFARSVAKRAVGTLSAQMLGELAGGSVPVTKGGVTL